jgi:hypothetical protein
VLYEWNVATTKPWMNLIAPIARPVFQWNHDWVMSRGGEGSPGCSAAACWPAAEAAESLSFWVLALPDRECQSQRSSQTAS